MCDISSIFKNHQIVKHNFLVRCRNLLSIEILIHLTRFLLSFNVLFIHVFNFFFLLNRFYNVLLKKGPRNRYITDLMRHIVKNNIILIINIKIRLNICMILILWYFNFLFKFIERKRENERERESKLIIIQ